MIDSSEGEGCGESGLVKGVVAALELGEAGASKEAYRAMVQG